jgi:hypothetical protein
MISVQTSQSTAMTSLPDYELNIPRTAQARLDLLGTYRLHQAPVEALARSLQIATAYQGDGEQSATFRHPIGLLPVACKETAVIGSIEPTRVQTPRSTSPQKSNLILKVCILPIAISLT